MHIISKLLTAAIVWLNTVDAPVEITPTNANWWDLPPHHPQ
jgi:hypothetical protein